MSIKGDIRKGEIMKNSLEDLNNHLFAAIERLNDEEITGDALRDEIGRAKAITDVAEKIIDNGTLVLRAEELRLSYSSNNIKIPKFLEGDT